MFYKYEVKNINGEDCLYLYLSLNYEFSNEFIDNQSLRSLSKSFINTNNINFKGKNIYYVVNGIVVKKLNLDTNKSIISDIYSPDNFLINLKLSDNSLCEITLREYLISILFNYYDNSIGDEVLKAICVLFNTYSYKMMRKDNFVSSLNDFYDYTNYKEYSTVYSNYIEIIDRFNNIINSVSCIYISYNDQLILPFIHLCNIGKTMSNKNYPYLSSVKSLWDLASPNYINIYDFNYDIISSLLDTNINNTTKIKVDLSSIIFGNKTFSTLEIKKLLKLNSSFINIIQNKKYIRFITQGIGDCLGLSIYGAISIEENGGNYINILNYYFPKTKIYRYIKELS